MADGATLSGPDLLMRPRTEDKRLARGRRFWLRCATAPLRALPDFMIVGAMKSGTSSLFDHVRQHPLVAPPYRKETHYLDLGRHRGCPALWYRAHFPLRARMRPGMITGEATPDYMFDPAIPPALRAMRPDLRLIVVLRNPVDRVISHYHHEVRMGREHLSLETALELEEARLATARKAGAEGGETLQHASYRRRSIYAPQLRILLEHFPRERVLVLSSRQLFDDPAAVMAETQEFLGLPEPGVPYEFRVKNSAPRRAEVSGDLRAGLEAFFAPHNARLFELLGRDLDW